MKGLPLSRFYSFDEIGDVSRGARLSFDAHGRLAVFHDGAYLVLNDEAWIDLMAGLANDVKIQSVSRSEEGPLYYGALGSWGVLTTTTEGALRPQSFAPASPPKWALLTIFTDIIPTDTGVFFAGRSGIVYWDRATRENTFFEVQGVARLFHLGSTPYVSTFDQSLFSLAASKSTVRLPAETAFSGIIVDQVAALPCGRAVVSTFGRQLFAWDGIRLTGFGGPISQRLSGRVSAIQALRENLFAVAISGAGLFIINHEGEIINALSDPDYRLISSLASNEPGVLWAATETGVAKILYGAPVTTFGQTLGLPVGWPQFVLWNGQTIVASNGRVYEPAAGMPGEPTRFRLMDPQPSAGAWGIATHGPWLLLGNSDGVFAKQPGQPFQTVLDDIAVARLQTLESGECLAIGEKQIAALTLASDHWRECAPRVPGLGYPSNVQASKKAAWIEIGANHAARIALRDGTIQPRVFDTYGWADPRWINVSIIDDTVILSGREAGRVYFDEKTEAIIEPPALEAVLQRMPYWPSRIQPDESGRWWVSHPHGLFTFNATADHQVSDTESYRVIHEHSPVVQTLPSREVWVSNGRTLFHVQPVESAPAPARQTPQLVSVRNLRTNREFAPIAPDLLRLSYSENSLGLRFFAGTYALRPTPEYEVRINQAAWNHLDAASLLRLSDLREGEYQLDVRFADPRGPFGEQASFAFVIMPPWFRTLYAQIGYALLAGALVFALVRLSLRRAEARNARLEKLVAERTGELKATMVKLEQETQTTATLAERNRLAGEIHDGVAQGFAGLAMQLEAMSRFAGCSPELQRELTVALSMLAYSRNEMHQVVQNLYSPVLASVDLETALKQMVARIAPTPGFATVAREGPARRLGSTIEHHLLRIAQEAVTNAVKHASAKHLAVLLTFAESEVEVTIEDDGCGFDPRAVLSGDFAHFGLPSFRGRADKIGGSVTIESRPGIGTRIQVRVPLTASNPP
jgi:signal transduction histidine kinase